MDGMTGDRQRPRRTPIVIPPIDLDVHSADVDGVESLMDRLTIVPSVPSVYSLASGTAPTPSLSVPVVRGCSPSFPLQSGGPRGDNMSVLSALTAPAALSGRSEYGGPIGGLASGDGGAGGGGAPSKITPRCPNMVSTPCYR